MRLHFHTAVPAAVTLVGLVSALSAPASASESDPASAVRGSLGISLEDLMFGSGAGSTVFLLNAAFLALFAAFAIGVRRANSRRLKHLRLRTANFPR
jgi:uncharacterized membrane protein